MWNTYTHIFHYRGLFGKPRLYRATICDKTEPFGPYLKYIGPSLMSTIGLGTISGSLDSNLILIKFIIRVYMANPDCIRQKQPIQGKVEPFRPYLDPINPIQVNHIGPKNTRGSLGSNLILIKVSIGVYINNTGNIISLEVS